MLKVLQPLKIANLTIKNRIIYAPMGYRYEDFGSRAHDYFVRRAQGGAGMLVMPIQACDTFEIPAMGAWLDESKRDDLEKIIQDAHKYDCKICIQLIVASGRLFDGVTKHFDTPVSASAVPALFDPNKICHALTTDEIKQIMADLRKTIKILKTTSVDALQIHGYGGYLPDQFLSARWNKRTDAYGGDVKGRARFVIEIGEIIKDVMGKDFPLLIKYCPVHGVSDDGFRQLDEGIELSKVLEANGFDMLCANAGCYERWYLAFSPIYQQEQVLQLSAVEEVRKHVKIPVASDGKMGYIEKGIDAMERDKCDALVIGRGMIADPDIPQKITECRTDDIRPCIGCNEGCIGRAFLVKPVACSVNPEVGFEGTKLIKKTKSPRKMLVVGGGPGGMQAALDAKAAGHDVELWEKSPALGGMIIAAGRPSFKIEVSNYISYLKLQMVKKGIKYKLCTEATADDILAGGFDTVIVASGAKPLMPNIPGIENKNVVNGVDAMLDRCTLGRHLVVVGGGLVGCETSVYLASNRGKTIDLIEMQPKLLPEPIFIMNEMMLTELIDKNPEIKTHVNTKLVEIKDGAVVIETDGVRAEISCDTVVIAIGLTSVNLLADQLQGKIDVKVIGDAVKPRHILEAVEEARDTVLSL